MQPPHVQLIKIKSLVQFTLLSYLWSRIDGKNLTRTATHIQCQCRGNSVLGCNEPILSVYPLSACCHSLLGSLYVIRSHVIPFIGSYYNLAAI